jgi:hypothetical protein
MCVIHIQKRPPMCSYGGDHETLTFYIHSMESGIKYKNEHIFEP